MIHDEEPWVCFIKTIKVGSSDITFWGSRLKGTKRRTLVHSDCVARLIGADCRAPVSAPHRHTALGGLRLRSHGNGQGKGRLS